jgi:hypothetical protein
VTRDGRARAAGLSIALDGAPAELELVRDGLWKPITDGDPGPLTLAERFRDVGLAGGEIDELLVFDRALAPLEVRELARPEEARALLDGASADERFAAWLAAVDAGQRALQAELTSARAALAGVQAGVREIMAMQAGGPQREVFVLRRGRYDAPDPARPVRAHVPRALVPARASDARPSAGAAADDVSDRLALADWMARPEHPLTARVAANRLWQLAFGRGLVATSENFGLQGELPSHPELLDWLALELVDDGWSTKGLLRTIVTSATYRQTSRADEALCARDPENRLLARGPAKRLEAEMLRDQALFAAGLLVERLGGPSVKPPQPAGLWEIGWGGTYVADEGEGRWRRSLYSYWKRTVPPPGMILFDAAKRDVCVARRASTCTPLQTLALLDDETYVEAARALAAHVLAERAAADLALAARAAGERASADRGTAERAAGDRVTGDRAAVEAVFRALATRAPTAAESAALFELLEHERAEFAADPAAVEALLAVGPAPVPAQVERADVAALALVASTVMASDAALYAR